MIAFDGSKDLFWVNLWVLVVTGEPAVWGFVEHESLTVVIIFDFNGFALTKIMFLLGILQVILDNSTDSEMYNGLSLYLILRLFVH